MSPFHPLLDLLKGMDTAHFGGTPGKGKGAEFSTTLIDMPRDVSTKVHAFMDAIPAEHRVTKRAVRRVHATVKQGLHTRQALDVNRVVAPHGPFRMHLGETVVFPATRHRPHDVVAVRVHSPALLRLRGAMESRLGHSDLHGAEFQPHITLGYVQAGVGQQYAGRMDFFGTQVPVSHITFITPEHQETRLPLGAVPGVRKALVMDFSSLRDLVKAILPESPSTVRSVRVERAGEPTVARNDAAFLTMTSHRYHLYDSGAPRPHEPVGAFLVQHTQHDDTSKLPMVTARIEGNRQQGHFFTPHGLRTIAAAVGKLHPQLKAFDVTRLKAQPRNMEALADSANQAVVRNLTSVDAKVKAAMAGVKAKMQTRRQMETDAVNRGTSIWQSKQRPNPFAKAVAFLLGVDGDGYVIEPLVKSEGAPAAEHPLGPWKVYETFSLRRLPASQRVIRIHREKDRRGGAVAHITVGKTGNIKVHNILDSKPDYSDDADQMSRKHIGVLGASGVLAFKDFLQAKYNATSISGHRVTGTRMTNEHPTMTRQRTFDPDRNAYGVKVKIKLPPRQDPGAGEPLAKARAKAKQPFDLSIAADHAALGRDFLDHARNAWAGLAGDQVRWGSMQGAGDEIPLHLGSFRVSDLEDIHGDHVAPADQRHKHLFFEHDDNGHFSLLDPKTAQEYHAQILNDRAARRR